MGILTRTVGGTENLVGFKTAARTPIESLKVHFKPAQNLNGYDKPWPNGRKNIFNYKTANIAEDVNRDYNGAEVEQLSTAYTRGFTSVKPSTVYTLSSSKTLVNYWYVYFLDNEGNWIRSSPSHYNVKNFSFTTPSTCYNIQIQGVTGAEWNIIQIEEGSNSTSFEPYGNECPAESRTKVDLYINNNPLPQEYQPVEYIQSKGAQRINTGLCYNSGDRIDIDFKMTGYNSETGVVFGAEKDKSIMCCVYLNNYYITYDNKPATYSNIFKSNDRHVISKRAGKWYVDDVYDGNGLDYTVKDYPITLFALNKPNDYTNHSYLRLYKYTHICKGVTNTFVPCYRKSDHRAGLYNTTNKMFYPNSTNTNDFICGPDIYTTKTVPVTFSKSILGGYIDVINGELVEEWHHETKHITGDMGTPGGSGTYSEDYRYIAYNLPSAYLVDNSKRDQALCNLAPYNQQNTEGIRFWVASGTVYLYLPADGKEYDVDIYYPCQKHETYQTGTIELKTCLGQNYIWSDTNDITELSYAIHDSAEIRAAKKRIIAASPHIVTPSPALIQTFNTDMASPLKGCKIHFVPMQEGTGDPSPENVRPITGWTGVNLYSSKAIDLSPINYTPETINGGLMTYLGDNRFSFTGNLSAITNFEIPINLHMVANKEYYMYIITSSVEDTNFGLSFRGSGIFTLVIKNNDSTVHDISYTPTSDKNFTTLRIKVAPAAKDFTFGLYITEDPATSIITNWSDSAGTIYGGYVDLVSGEVVKEWETVKIADLNWYNYSGKIHYYTMLPLRERNTYIYTDTLTPRTTGAFTQETVGELTYYGEGTTSIYKYVWTKVPEVMEQTDANTWIKNTYADATICYKLETPTLLATLTPTQLKTLRGTNNIWSNTNDNITVKYWKH